MLEPVFRPALLEDPLAVGGLDKAAEDCVMLATVEVLYLLVDPFADQLPYGDPLARELERELV
jgi:hypothetical protein